MQPIPTQLPDSIKQLVLSGKSLKDIMKTKAPAAIATIDSGLTLQGQQEIRDFCKDIHQMLEDVTAMDLVMVSLFTAFLDKQEIINQIEDGLNQLDVEGVEQSIEYLKELTNIATEDQAVGVVEGLNRACPARLRTMFNIASAKNIKMLSAYMREEYQHAKNASEDDLFVEAEHQIEYFPVNELADLILDFAQRLDPQDMSCAANDFAYQVDADDLADCIITGLRFARDVFEAAQHGNMFDITDTQNAKDFAKNLNYILLEAEDAMFNNGLLTPKAETFARKIGKNRKEGRALVIPMQP